MRQVGYVYGLVDHQVINQPRERMNILQHRSHSPKTLGPLGFVIPVDVRWPIKVINNQCMLTHNAGVGMRVKL